MTRAELLALYPTNKHGIIECPGKFEGEMIYVPYFWEKYLDGFADDDGLSLRFKVLPEDRIEFPELKRRRTVRLRQMDAGFVCEC